MPAKAADARPSGLFTPEQFALRAEILFTDGRLAPGQHAAVVYRDERQGLEVIPTGKKVREHLAQSPLSNAQRENAVVELFKTAGASEFDVVLQDIGTDEHNVIVVKKGRTDRVIVIGGHHDKIMEGPGVIDNWTGATMVANLYHEMHMIDTDATLVFIAFGGTEDGLLGSSAYLDSLTAAQKKDIDAMLNFDGVGVNGTYSWSENASRSLLARAEQVAKDSRRELKEATRSLNADSTSFRRAGIPAMTILGMTQDMVYEVLHSEAGRNAPFSVRHYKNSFILAREILKSLDHDALGFLGRWKA